MRQCDQAVQHWREVLGTEFSGEGMEQPRRRGLATPVETGERGLNRLPGSALPGAHQGFERGECGRFGGVDGKPHEGLDELGAEELGRVSRCRNQLLGRPSLLLVGGSVTRRVAVELVHPLSEVPDDIPLGSDQLPPPLAPFAVTAGGLRSGAFQRLPLPGLVAVPVGDDGREVREVTATAAVGTPDAIGPIEADNLFEGMHAHGLRGRRMFAAHFDHPDG